MNALDRIFEQIKRNAEVEIESLRVENEKQCAELVAKNNSLIEVERQELVEKIEDFKQSFRFKVDSENLIFKSKKILATKQKVILIVKHKVVEALCFSDAYAERYFDFMENLINMNLPVGECVLIYGRLDYLRFLKNLKFKEEDFLKIEKSDEFNHGALVRCNDFEVNLNMEELVSDWFFKFKSEILSILTQGELFCEQV